MSSSPKRQKTSLKIGYWAIRGLGAPCRMAPAYAGVEYESVEYTVKPKEGGGWDLSAWHDVKPEFKEKNALMNLPYVEDGDVLVSQSNACLLYLGRKLGLVGKTEAEMSRVEQALCEITDLRNATVRLVYGDDFKDKVGDHLAKTVPAHYGKLEGFLGQSRGGHKYFAGADPTVADFHMFEMIDQHERMAKSVGQTSPVAGFPILGQLYAGVRAEPKLAAYFSGPQYALPQNNTMAQYGSDLQDGR